MALITPDEENNDKGSSYLLITYICFDICSGIERDSSHGQRKRARMQFPQTFCPFCDKQGIASALGQFETNFTCIFKVFQTFFNCFATRAILGEH